MASWTPQPWPRCAPRGSTLAVTTEARTLSPPVDALQVPRIDAANTDVRSFARLLESLAV